MNSTTTEPVDNIPVDKPLVADTRTLEEILAACKHKQWLWIWETTEQGERVWTDRIRCSACNIEREIVYGNK